MLDIEKHVNTELSFFNFVGSVSYIFVFFDNFDSFQNSSGYNNF